MKPFFVSVFKGVAWVIVTSFFGLLQFGVTLLLSQIFSNITIEVNVLLKDGVALFFAVSLSSAVLVDYLFSGRNDRIGLVFLFLAMPFLIIFLSGSVYAALSVTENDELISFTELQSIQLIVLFLSLLYALVLKSVLLFGEMTPSSGLNKT